MAMRRLRADTVPGRPLAAAEQDAELVEEEAELAEDALEAEASGQDLEQVEERLEVVEAQEEDVEALAQVQAVDIRYRESEAEAEEEEVEAPGDIEPGLDEIVRFRIEAEIGSEPLAESTRRDVRPSSPPAADEFVCRSCFLVKRRTQLADPARMWCRDCANNESERRAPPT